MPDKRKKKKSGGRFIGLSHSYYDSSAWKSLSSDAKCIFLELKRRYYGSNNGYITLSYREAANVFHGSKDTASKRLKELQVHGFIKLTNKGVYQNRHATEWLLTTEIDDRNNHPPSNEWRDYRPS